MLSASAKPRPKPAPQAQAMRAGSLACCFVASGFALLPLTAWTALPTWTFSASKATAQPAARALADPVVLASTEMALPAQDDHGRATYDFVAHALREAAAADVALVDMRRVQGSLQRGRVTAQRLRQLLPWDGTLVRYEMSGADLQQLLAKLHTQLRSFVWSGLSASATRPGTVSGGDREDARTTTLVDGAALRPEGRYRVVMLDSAPAPAYASAERLHVTFHESLTRHLLAHPFLRATPEGRVVAEDLPASVQCREQLQAPSAK